MLLLFFFFFFSSKIRLNILKGHVILGLMLCQPSTPLREIFLRQKKLSRLQEGRNIFLIPGT